MTEARDALNSASKTTQHVRAASRWFPWYMLIMAVLGFALIVMIEVYFESGLARFGALLAWAVAILLLGRWADTHDVHPAGSGRRIRVATLIWFGSYLLLVGPIVRLQTDESLASWAAASAVLTLPFLIGAWWEWKRS